MRPRPLLALLLCGLLSGCERRPQPPAADLRLAASEVPAAVLAACQGPLRQRLDRLDVRLRLGDGSEWRAYAALPQSLRLQGSDGSLLLHDGEAYRLGGSTTDVSAAQRQRLLQVRALLDAAVLGPLQRAVDCTAIADGHYRLQLPDGELGELRLQSGSLLPAELRTAAMVFTFREFLPTSSAWMPQRITATGLGDCLLEFELADIAWRADFFAPPDSATSKLATSAAATRVPLLPPGAEPRSAEPFAVAGNELRRVLLADPGDWAARAARYTPVHDELLRQGQAIAGFPMLFQRDGQDWLAVPFRRRPQGPECSPPADWRVETVPAGKWLVVYPADGDWQQRAATGRDLLQAELRRRELTASGPVVWQPFVHLHEGAPDASKLQQLVVRVSVAFR